MTTKAEVEVGFCSCGARFKENPLNPPAEAIVFHMVAGHTITIIEDELDNDATGFKK